MKRDSDSQHEYEFKLGMSILASAILMLIVAIVALILTYRAARADAGLPGGVSCAQVVQYSRMMQIPNTRWGRAQARLVAAALGVYLTEKELDAAAECLRQHEADQRYGCTQAQQAPNGECR